MLPKPIAAAIVLLLWHGVAVAQTTDVDVKIRTGIDLIKLACGTGSAQNKLTVDGKTGLEISLKKLPSFEGGGTINYTSSEAQGLIIALKNEMNSDVVNLSKAQMDCMKPYADRIFDVIFPPRK
jgi:hypothetical protein